MKWMPRYLMLVLGFGCLVGPSRSQPAPVERFTLTFSDATRPGVLYDTVAHGSIIVEGYDGDTVMVDVYRRAGAKPAASPGATDAEGLRTIPSRGFDIEAFEDDNVIRIQSRSAQVLDFTIRVPRSTSLRLTSFEDGDVRVEGVYGAIEASAREGGVYLDDVAGPVVADARDGEIIARFNTADFDMPMAFTSRDGTLDVTFPPTLRAVLKMRTDLGEIRTDFAFEPMQGKTEARRSPSSVRLESYTYGAVGGGGPELTLLTREGDIIIRKGQ